MLFFNTNRKNNNFTNLSIALIIQSKITLNAEHDENKLSYVRFDQARFVHYRRIENIMVNDKVLTRKVKPEDMIEVNKKFLEFMNFQLTNENN